MTGPVAIGVVAQSFWWVGIALFLLVVVPVVVLVANRVVSATRRILEAADEIVAGAARIEGNLGELSRLEDLRAKAERAGERGRRFARIRTGGRS